MLTKDCHPLDEIFHHVNPDNGRDEYYNASAMNRAAVKDLNACELVWVAIDPEFVEFIKKNRGLEAHKIARLKEPYLSRPIVAVEWGDGTVLTVDGHHRYVKQAEEGRTNLRAFLFRLGTWEKFRVTDL